uniref:Uncharacterized protein n=1 Tax=Chelonoidis abingdonii TaxID=106734 RepID=A0A8C0H5R3_CHEAB
MGAPAPRPVHAAPQCPRPAGCPAALPARLPRSPAAPPGGLLGALLGGAGYPGVRYASFHLAFACRLRLLAGPRCSALAQPPPPVPRRPQRPLRAFAALTAYLRGRAASQRRPPIRKACSDPGSACWCAWRAREPLSGYDWFGLLGITGCCCILSGSVPDLLSLDPPHRSLADAFGYALACWAAWPWTLRLGHLLSALDSAKLIHGRVRLPPRGVGGLGVRPGHVHACQEPVLPASLSTVIFLIYSGVLFSPFGVFGVQDRYILFFVFCSILKSVIVVMYLLMLSYILTHLFHDICFKDLRCNDATSSVRVLECAH